MTQRADVVVLLARQRSGTNALQSVLDAHPALDCTREVFHADPDGHEHLDPAKNWFRFLERRGGAGIMEVLTAPGAAEGVFEEFLLHLRSLSTKRYVVVDVKYNSTHGIDGPWRDPTAEPAMLRFIRERGLPVLQLRRRNHLRSHVSLLTARQTREWLAAPASAADDGAAVLRLDAGRLVSILRRYRDDDELIERRVPERQRLTLEYEELFPQLDGPVAADQLGRLAAWLGIPDTFPELKPAYRKQSVRPLSALIGNYDEVVAALRGTAFEYCLEDEASYRAAGLA